MPRLNARGIQFKWAGYRMPEEIGENAEVTRLQDYVAARTLVQYLYEKASGAATETNGFSVDNVSVFVGGAIGKAYGGLVELARAADGEVEALVSASSVWGSERRFGGLRAGQGHMLALGGGVAGFDRAIGIAPPLPFGMSNTAVPLNLGGDLVGVEAFLVAGSNRSSVQVVNAVGGEAEGSRSTSKDLVLTNQFVWDAAGAGIGAAVYLGSTQGLAAEAASERSRYTRVAVTANKYMGNFEALGAYVLSRDRDLPVGDEFARARVDGRAFWFSGQHTFRPSPLTLFSRWEVRDPDGDAVDDADRRFVAGGVLPLNLPEFLRLALEYRRDLPQGGSRPRRNGLAVEFQMTF
ncbi:MAG: hypothetical protein ABS52_04465 [Gemmatimonadetes bacterium SCN 70-22]|nr:MAG: hypothetical protein ABS52_04465 [Gemmatimonadetes bacterium SCN 70-22]